MDYLKIKIMKYIQTKKIKETQKLKANKEYEMAVRMKNPEQI